jgi:CheY-like chemotaxis protein
MTNILLAEDDADDRMFFEDALKLIPIHTQLTVANNGLELMNTLNAMTEPPPPHVIFLDLNMPLKNGFQCLQEIRDNPELKGIPVVIFSTSANDDAVDRAYQHGANHYIRKPLSFSLLVKTIEMVLKLNMRQDRQPPKNEFVLAIA